jgi:hypothetical protein
MRPRSLAVRERRGQRQLRRLTSPQLPLPTPEAVVNPTCQPSFFELGLKLLQQVCREIGSSYVKADLVQTIVRQAGLGSPIHAADDDMVLVPCQKLGMELGITYSDQVDETVKSFPMFCDMSTLCGTGVAREVNSDILDTAASYFSRIEERRHHGRADLVRTTDEPLVGFMCRHAKQSLVIVGIKDCQLSLRMFCHPSGRRQHSPTAPKLGRHELQYLHGTAGT